MKPIHLLAAAALLTLATPALADDPPRAPEPAKPVDAATFFTGRWYEIGRTPMTLTNGCLAATTDYVTRDGKLVDHDACHDPATGKETKKIDGPITILNPGANTKIKVAYRLAFIPLTRIYWILDHGEGWFIQSDPDFEHFNLFTRDPRPSEASVAELKARVKALGSDPARLEFPATMGPGQR